MSKKPFVSHRMDIVVAVERLRTEHGEERARRVALMEQQRARRARSRRRFQFWASVASQMIGVTPQMRSEA